MSFNAGNGKKYKVEIIQNNIIYVSKEDNYLLSLYHL